MRSTFRRTTPERHVACSVQNPVARRSTSEHPEIQGRQSKAIPSSTGTEGRRQVERGTRVTDTKHYTYRVAWSGEDGEYVATVVEFPSMSWLHAEQGKALSGLVELVDQVVADLEVNGESVPEPIADRRFSGKFNVRLPESLHRELALAAAEEGVSLNRLVSDRLAHI